MAEFLLYRACLTKQYAPRALCPTGADLAKLCNKGLCPQQPHNAQLRPIYTAYTLSEKYLGWLRYEPTNYWLNQNLICFLYKFVLTNCW